MVDLLIENIGELVTMDDTPGNPLGVMRDAALACAAGRVAFVGAADDARAFPMAPDCRRVDAGGRLVTPGLVDPHAHPIFAGNRAGEFAMRIAGATYGEIQAQGGGIYSTVRATREASDESLIGDTVRRLERMARQGTTTCEAKSGYLLDLAGEERLLRLLDSARSLTPVRVSPTLLAHVLPADVDRDAYLRAFAEDLIPRIARARLADACDVYCDAGAFCTLAEARVLLEAGKRAGLGLHVHAEQFTRTGATALAAELGAWSADHLEAVTDEDIAALRSGHVVATLLPGAAATLRLPAPPARALLDAGVLVALGTDCNPGSSMTESMPLMMSLGCMLLGMTVDEVWQAATRNAARALGRDDLGHLCVGAHADLVIWNAASRADVPYQLGATLADQVFIAGALV